MIAAEHLEANRIPAVSVLLESQDFFRLDEAFIYPVVPMSSHTHQCRLSTGAP